MVRLSNLQDTFVSTIETTQNFVILQVDVLTGNILSQYTESSLTTPDIFNIQELSYKGNRVYLLMLDEVNQIQSMIRFDLVNGIMKAQRIRDTIQQSMFLTFAVSGSQNLFFWAGVYQHNSQHYLSIQQLKSTLDTIGWTLLFSPQSDRKYYVKVLYTNQSQKQIFGCSGLLQNYVGANQNERELFYMTYGLHGEQPLTAKHYIFQADTTGECLNIYSSGTNPALVLFHKTDTDTQTIQVVRITITGTVTYQKIVNQIWFDSDSCLKIDENLPENIIPNFVDITQTYVVDNNQYMCLQFLQANNPDNLQTPKWCILARSSFISDKDYYIGVDLELDYIIDPFTSKCPGDEFTYSAEKFTSQDPSNTALPSFVQFNGAIRRFQIKAEDNLYAGTYIFKVIGQPALLADSTSRKFQLFVHPIITTTTLPGQTTTVTTTPAPNLQKPQFVSDLEQVTAYLGQTKRYNLPNIINPLGNAFSIIATFSSSDSDFIKFMSSQNAFKIIPTQQSQLGNHLIQIKIRDKVIQTIFSIYYLSITVKEKIQSTTKQPTATIVSTSSMNQTQNITNSSSNTNKSTNSSQNTSNHTTSQPLDLNDLKLEDFSMSPLSNTNYTSKILELQKKMINKDTFDVQFQPIISKIDQTGLVTILFGKTLEIPASYEYFNDNVIMINLISQSGIISSSQRILSDIASQTSNKKMFTWKAVGFTQKDMKIKLVFQYPDLISQGTSIMVQQYSEDTTYAFQKILLGNFALTMILSATLQYLWGMINALQIILHMPLMDVKFPSNTKFVFGQIISISQLDILPEETILNYFFSFPLTGAYNDRFLEIDIF
ncbi:UNKNOWN [Stylonychia lemnae]|uniref:Cadg domain containing protein n=1 Tax=Stylonychia lemnae TaxID=5949 RepID=A0A078B978_STYLE|nr:UNKNOWN [Stylonychia lemnae]|eukprot:CDW90934.1 UNKNOWN [Stylonychia lemnae]